MNQNTMHFMKSAVLLQVLSRYLNVMTLSSGGKAKTGVNVVGHVVEGSKEEEWYACRGCQTPRTYVSGPDTVTTWTNCPREDHAVNRNVHLNGMLANGLRYDVGVEFLCTDNPFVPMNIQS